MSQTDEETRRQLISLVHRLQRERGATAAWVAGGGGGGVRPCACGTGSLVSDLRRRTDRLLTDEVASELRLLRDAADHALRDHGLGQSGSEEASVRARTCFSTLSGYSALVKSVSTRAYAGMRHSLHLTATLKEMYAQQRGFLVGAGALLANALGALPSCFDRPSNFGRSSSGRTLSWRRRRSGRTPLRAQLEAAIAVDDEKTGALRLAGPTTTRSCASGSSRRAPSPRRRAGSRGRRTSTSSRRSSTRC